MTSVAEWLKKAHDVCRAALEQLEAAKDSLTSDDFAWARQRFEWWAANEATIRNAIEHPHPRNVPSYSNIPSISPDLDDFDLGDWAWKANASIEATREEESRSIEIFAFVREEFTKDSARLRWLNVSNEPSSDTAKPRRDPLEVEYEEAMQNDIAHPVISYAAVGKAWKKSERGLRNLIEEGKLERRGRMITTQSVKSYLEGKSGTKRH